MSTQSLGHGAAKSWQPCPPATTPCPQPGPGRHEGGKPRGDANPSAVDSPLPPPPWRPRAVLFDRDGTLVVDVPYNADPDLVVPPTAHARPWTGFAEPAWP